MDDGATSVVASTATAIGWSGYPGHAATLGANGRISLSGAPGQQLGAAAGFGVRGAGDFSNGLRQSSGDLSIESISSGVSGISAISGVSGVTGASGGSGGGALRPGVRRAGGRSRLNQPAVAPVDAISLGEGAAIGMGPGPGPAVAAAGGPNDGGAVRAGPGRGRENHQLQVRADILRLYLLSRCHWLLIAIITNNNSNSDNSSCKT